jgi:hypothetical protein
MKKITFQEIDKNKILQKTLNEKAPKVLTLKEEINKKENEDLTVEQLLQKITNSENLNKNFELDNKKRFNIHLAEAEKNQLKDILSQFNEIHKMDFSFKFIKVLNGNTKNKEELIYTLETLDKLIDCRKIHFEDVMKIKKIDEHKIYKLKMLKEKDIKELPSLKTYLLDNKKRTVKEVKEEYENQKIIYKNKIDNLFEDSIQDFFVTLFKEFTYKEEDAFELYRLFIKLTFGDKSFTKESENSYKALKDFNNFKNRVFSILKAYSKY